MSVKAYFICFKVPTKMTTLTVEMLALQELILENRVETLTDAQIYNLISEKTSPELVILLLGALNKEILDPDMLLIQSIRSARIEDDLILVGLALRFGADANIYVDSDRGTIHILAYAYDSVNDKVDKSVMDIMIAILLTSGSSFVMKVFDTNNVGQLMPSNQDLFNKNVVGVSVIQWLNTNYSDNIIGEIAPSYNSKTSSTSSTSSLQISNSLRNKVGIYLDKPELIVRDELPVTELHQIIKSHAVNVFILAIIGVPSNILVKQNLLRSSVVNYNITSYRAILDKGIKPDYAFINDLMTRLNKIKTASFTVGFIQIDAMLIENVKNGVEIDSNQLSYLSSIDSGSSERLEKTYATPHWKKVCNVNSGKPDDELKLLALSLNIPDVSSDKCEICNYITDLSKNDPQQLKEAAIRRQELKVSAATLGASDYIESIDQPLKICRNRKILTKDPYDFNDVQLAYYVDSKDVNWCYTSDMYDNLLAGKKNPTTGEQLPDNFIGQLKNKQRTLTSLGIETVNTTTFSEGVDKLTRQDKISDRVTNRELEIFKSTAQINGINSLRFKNMSQQQLQSILTQYGRSVNLIPLTQEHAYVTFARVSNNIIANNPQLAGSLLTTK